MIYVTILSYYLHYTISSLTSSTESFFINHKMAAKKGHVEEAPVSQAAKRGINKIKSGDPYVNLNEL